MGEKLRESHEQKHGAEKLDADKEARLNLERLREAAENTGPEQDQKQLEHNVETHAKSGEEVSIEQPEESQPVSPAIQKELKNTSYKRTINQVQQQLPAAQRVLSKVIHQPAVEKISNAGARTIARPSGILGGGFAALAGSSFLLFLGKYYGFNYNYFVFVLLFAAGFISGLVIEGFIKLLSRHRA